MDQPATQKQRSKFPKKSQTATLRHRNVDQGNRSKNKGKETSK